MPIIKALETNRSSYIFILILQENSPNTDLIFMSSNAVFFFYMPSILHAYFWTFIYLPTPSPRL